MNIQKRNREKEKERERERERKREREREREKERERERKRKREKEKEKKERTSEEMEYLNRWGKDEGSSRARIKCRTSARDRTTREASSTCSVLLYQLLSTLFTWFM
jgi:centrosomal protein CEP76